MVVACLHRQDHTQGAFRETGLYNREMADAFAVGIPQSRQKR